MSEKKNTILAVLALVCALAALALSLLNTFRPGPDQAWENPALEEQNAEKLYALMRQQNLI